MCRLSAYTQPANRKLDASEVVRDLSGYAEKHSSVRSLVVNSSSFMFRKVVPGVAACALVAGLNVIAVAPSASADPAPAVDENAYIGLLPNTGMNVQTAAQQQLALKMGYLLCMLDKQGGTPANQAQQMALSDAQLAGLCNFVSASGPTNAASQISDQQIQINSQLQQQHDKTIESIIDGMGPHHDDDY